MNGRRRFFALVSNAAVAGLVTHRASAKAPMLILPPTGLIEASETLTAPGRSQMDLFIDWLGGGLRMVEGCKPGGQIFRAMEMDRAEGLRACPSVATSNR